MRLLVSVASPQETLPAVKGGADIIDIKNPAEGALGANFPRNIAQIKALTPNNLEVSATIGDMPNLPGTASLAALGAACLGVDYVKVGLKGPKTVEQAVKMMTEVRLAVQQLENPPKIIATAYGDADTVGAVSPLKLPLIASESKVHGCLIDTLSKKSGGLLNVLNLTQLKNFVLECEKLNLLSGLAGSLSLDTLAQACRKNPDLVGVRTAALNNNDRVKGLVNQEKVQALKKVMLENACL